MSSKAVQFNVNQITYMHHVERKSRKAICGELRCSHHRLKQFMIDNNIEILKNLKSVQLDAKKIKNLHHDQRKSISFITKEFKCKREELLNFMSLHNIAVSINTRSPILDAEKVTQLHHVEHKTITDMTDILHCCRQSIIAFMKENNIEIFMKSLSPSRPLEIKDILHLHHDEQRTLDDISSILKCRRARLVEFMQNNNIEILKSDIFNDPDITDVLRLNLEQGLTIGYISEELGFSCGKIRKVLRAHDVELQNRLLHLPLREIFNTYKKDETLTLSEIAENYNCSVTAISYYFKKHNVVVRKCKVSKQEKALAAYVSSISSVAIDTSCTGIIGKKELDIYLPTSKLAFEFNGLFWHNSKSLGRSDPAYHFTKTFLCEDQGISLMHVFSDDWVYKNEMIKNYIKNTINESIITGAVLEKTSKDDWSAFEDIWGIPRKDHGDVFYSILDSNGATVAVCSLSKDYVLKSVSSIVSIKFAFAFFIERLNPSKIELDRSYESYISMYLSKTIYNTISFSKPKLSYSYNFEERVAVLSNNDDVLAFWDSGIITHNKGTE